MDKLKIKYQLEICISIMKETDNTFVTELLKEITNDLEQEWQESEMYYEQIKQILHHDET